MSERARMALFIASLIALFTGVSLLVRATTRFDYARDHASTRTNPWGTKAWRELLERSEVATQTWLRPLTDLTDDVRFVVVLDPTRPIRVDEQQALERWVRRGGRLVIAPFADPGAGELGARWTRATTAQTLESFGVTATDSGRADATARPAAQCPLTDDVSRVLIPTVGRLSVDEDAEGVEVLLTDDAGEIAAVAVRHGEGMAVVLAEVEILANATIRRVDNVVLAANLVFADGAPETVHFDEFHHGFGDDGDVFVGPEVDVTPFRNTALALLAVGAVYAIGRSRRFGAAVRRSDAGRRSSADYVRALAQVYARGEATATAASMLAAGLRRRAASAAAMPSSAPVAALAGELNRRRLPGDEIAELLAKLEDAEDEMRDGELLTLAQHVAHYERML